MECLGHGPLTAVASIPPTMSTRWKRILASRNHTECEKRPWTRVLQEDLSATSMFSWSMKCQTCIFWYLLIYCMCDGTNHSSMNMTHIQVPGTPWHPFLAAPCIVVQVEQSNGAPDDYYICHWFAAQELTENIRKLYSIHGTWSANSAQTNLLVISLYGLNPLWDPGRRGSTELHTSSFESSFWTGSVSV